jgi:RHS repeat-associated protein
VYLHQGGRYDGETGLYDFRNRFYDPEKGRWLNLDPMGFDAGDSNLYRYEGNDPISVIDPSGLKLKIWMKDKEAAKEAFSLLKKLYPDGNLQMDDSGVVTLGPGHKVGKASSAPVASECIADIINSRYVWEIRPNIGDSASQDKEHPRGAPVFPTTKPDNYAAGIRKTPGGEAGGEGTGGTIWVPVSKSVFEFGAYDPTGVIRAASLEVILAHELCGHAWFFTKGLEDPRPLNKEGRLKHNGHDQSIEYENLIRAELQGKPLDKMDKSQLRGTSKNEKRGESAWRKKGSDKWIELPPPGPQDLRKD